MRSSPLARLVLPAQRFIQSESAGGIMLIVAALVAFAWANSPWAGAYLDLQHVPFVLGLGTWSLELSLHHLVNDGLMALFFLLVGLEIKREIVSGELKDPRTAALAGLAACGGAIVPAVIYAVLNWGTPALAGWGVPMATDIAFALGVVALLGRRVPVGLKVFLAALAIVDDLIAVLVIAVFYTSDLSFVALAISLAVLALAFLYGRAGGGELIVFGLLGVVAWYFMLQSGVHATVAGVLLAMTLPIRQRRVPEDVRRHLEATDRTVDPELREARLSYVEAQAEAALSPLHRLEHLLLPWSTFLIVPVFALFNAGVSLGRGVTLGNPVTLGVLVGLLVGKPIGILLASSVAVRLGLAALPQGVNWGQMLSVGFVAGIGFTMALFIGGLAFDSPIEFDEARLGIMAASVIAAAGGLLALRLTSPLPEPKLTRVDG